MQQADARTRLATNLALAAIALASAVALAWPALPWSAGAGEVPARAGVVLRAIDGPADSPRIGGQAPDFEWTTPAGKTQRLSQLRGRTVVLNFWATWCEPCREEMPALDRAAQADPALAVLALDLDESADKIDSFIASYRIAKVEAILDAGKKMATRYGVVGLPTTFFIGPDGIVRHLEIRGMDAAVIQAGLAKAR
ncbi:MAG TPA: TlpA disulfide reductase family protein [Candidatus Limnocylindria bacterium]|nr:TlpA disulfide reductase family protein [Candidatus Limnocylindria bacterium]